MMKLIGIGLLITLATLRFPIYWSDFKDEFFHSTSESVNTSDSLKSDNLEGNKLHLEQVNVDTISKPEQCSILNPFENNDELMYSASMSIRNTIQSAITAGIDLDGLDFISYETRIPIPLPRFEYVRQQNYSYIKKYPNESVPIFGESSWFDSMSSDSLKLTLEINSISKEEVLVNLTSGSLNNTTFYVYGGNKTTLLGFLYAKAPWFSINDVEEFIDAGYSPTLSDLAFFTSEGIDLNIIQLMWRHASGDASSIHKFPPTYESLASIALVHGNFELLKFWLSKESPINPDPLGVSALSKFLFAKKQRSYSQEEEANIINEIAKTPLSQSDYNLMVSVFRTYLDSDISDRLSVHSIKFLEKKKQDSVLGYIKKISEIVLNPLSTKPNSEKCTVKYVRHTVDYILNHLKEKQIEERLNKSSKLSLSIELSEFMSRVSQSKIEEEAAIEKSFFEKANELKEKRTDALTEKDNTTINEVLAAAKANNWQLALQLLELMGTNKQSALNTLLSIALNTSKDTALFIELINRGAQIQASAYMQLLISNNVEAVEALIPHGLNVEVPMLAGGCVIKDIVKFGTPEMFKIFLKNGSMPNLNIDGMDALDVLLKRFSLKDNDVVFLQLLMQNIANVEKSHIAFVYQLAKTSDPEFKYIESKYPGLTEFREELLNY
ncbi:hypothetical protein AADZ91_11630 [Colwelliaceae bacterium 6441]